MDVVETPTEQAPQGQTSAEVQQVSERDTIEQEAVARYKESQLTEAERGQGTPEGYNDDGTATEELLAGKFKTQDDLLTAYKELEKKLGQPKEDTAAPAEEASGDAPASPVNFDTSSYEAEFSTNGSLSENSYAELAKKGFDKNAVDQYIQGQTYYAKSIQSDVYGTVGGQDNYTEIVQWASQNLEPEIIKEYNDAVDTLNVAKVKRDLEYMQLKMGQNQPTPTRRIEGDSVAGGLQPFTDKNEWQRAQTNRLYGKDAKYTNMVDSRYLAARKKGII